MNVNPIRLHLHTFIENELVEIFHLLVLYGAVFSGTSSRQLMNSHPTKMFSSAATTMRSWSIATKDPFGHAFRQSSAVPGSGPRRKQGLKAEATLHPAIVRDTWLHLDLWKSFESSTLAVIARRCESDWPIYGEQLGSLLHKIFVFDHDSARIYSSKPWPHSSYMVLFPSTIENSLVQSIRLWSYTSDLGPFFFAFSASHRSIASLFIWWAYV